MKEYNYVNAYGIHKKLVVNAQKDGKYYATLWSMDTGDFCGSCDMTPEQLNDYLEHFGINERS